MMEATSISVGRDRFNLDGRVALVAGASRGLGAATAVALAEAGAKVVLLSRTEKELAVVADQANAVGEVVKILVCDVTDSGKLKSAISSLDS
jgi:7-alpha-hydroxysteroid dehydrogenase